MSISQWNRAESACKSSLHLSIIADLQRTLRLSEIKMDNFLQPVFLLCALGFHATVAEEIIYAQVGEDVSLTTPLKESKRYYIWYFDNKQIAQLNPFGRKDTDPEWANRLTLSPGSLLIRNVTQSDFSIFSCIVKKALEEIGRYAFKLIQLNVAVNPPVVLPGERLSLTCGIRSQDHTPRIHWLNPQGQKLEGSAGKPTVQATRLHSGQWTCVVSKEKRVNVKVTVIDLLPLAPIPTRYSSESAPTPLTIPCSLAADNTWDQVQSKDIHQVGWNFCPPKPHCNKSSLFLLSLEGDKATWKTLTDRAVRPSLNPGSGDLSLGGNLAREGDGGDYECFVKFQNGVTLNRTVRVEVLRIIATPGTQLTTGQQLNLTCTTGHPLPPDIHIEWIPPKDASLPAPSLPPSAQDLRSPHLTVNAVGSDQNGTWRCELRRDGTVLTSAVVVLNIEPTFSSWMLVTLCAAAAILILLVILIVILQRRRQRRTRRHKRLCKCKNPKPKGFYRS